MYKKIVSNFKSFIAKEAAMVTKFTKMGTHFMQHFMSHYIVHLVTRSLPGYLLVMMLIDIGVDIVKHHRATPVKTVAADKVAPPPKVASAPQAWPKLEYAAAESTHVASKLLN